MDTKTPEVDEQGLLKKAEEDPKSKRWNNPNSRKNLKQYKEPPVDPEIVEDDQEEEEISSFSQAEEITRGRKIDPHLVKKLIPKRTVLTAAEKSVYNGVVITFLSDFKNEEPTASDIDDLMEIALCQVMENRLLEFSKHQPGSLIASSQSLERFGKRKQKAKENLAHRRVDRKDARTSQDVNIVDLVARFDNQRQEVEKQRVEKLLKDTSPLRKDLKDLVEKEVL